MESVVCAPPDLRLGACACRCRGVPTSVGGIFKNMVWRARHHTSSVFYPAAAAVLSFPPICSSVCLDSSRYIILCYMNYCCFVRRVLFYRTCWINRVLIKQFYRIYYNYYYLSIVSISFRFDYKRQNKIKQLFLYNYIR